MLSRLSSNFVRRSTFRLVQALDRRRMTSHCETDECCEEDSKGRTYNGQDTPLVRPIEPGKVRFGFLPEEWFQFFYPTTGVTGPYVFGFGLLTYLFSKEIYVMEHEFYSGLSLAIMCVAAVKKLGPMVAQWTDKEVDRIENECKAGRKQHMEAIKNAIEDEKMEQWRAEGARMLVEAKRENIALQLEAAYREAAWQCYQDIKRRLDYQVACRNVENRLNRKNMVQWVVKHVVAELPGEVESESIQKSIGDLSAMAVRVK